MIVGPAELAKVVNRLYWDSDESVNRIAESLELSKGALYGLIEPIAASGACPDCASPLSFTNRTARDRGLAECTTCSLADEPDDRLLPPAAPDSPHPTGVRAPRRWSGRALVGSLLLGVVAGVLIVRLVRRP